MDDPRVVSRDEWLAARRKLLAQEKDFTRQRDALNTGRRELPTAEIDQDCIFQGPDGRASLPGLFERRGQLLIYHFMSDPGWDEGCRSCSFLADGTGHLARLHARDTMLAMISRAPLAKLTAFRQRMGWTVPWYSSSSSDFNDDFCVTLDPALAPVQDNYRDLNDLGPDWPGRTGEMHGLSAFLRRGDRVVRTCSRYARGTGMAGSTCQWLDLTARGRPEDREQPPGRSDGPLMSWLRHHDRYDA